MKALIYSLAVVGCFQFSHNAFSRDENPRRFLQFEGKIYQTGMDVRCSKKNLDSAYIFIYDEKNLTTDTVMTSYSGNYSFKLPLNSEFMITISKKGFVSKMLHANTKVPMFSRTEHTLEFEMDLFKKIEGVDVSILNKPVANIYFDSKKKSFNYNRAYTDQVNRKLKSSYTAYYRKNGSPQVPVLKTTW